MMRRSLVRNAVRRRPAFTQVEILVTIAIILLLVSLVLPMLGKTREVARGSQCKDHLHNLLIGLTNYQYSHGSYPAGVLTERRPVRSAPGGDGLSWIVRLLPYIEQKPLYDRIDFARPVEAQLSRDVEMDVIQCPSDWVESRGGPAPATYAACHHHVAAPIDIDNHGSFLLGRGLSPVDFPDGLSHTLLLSEKEVTPDDRGWMSGSRATLRNTGSPLRRSRSVAPDPRRPAPAGDPLAVGGFSSAHAHGVHFGLGDGATRLVSFEVDHQFLQRLADRADGELIPQTEFNRRSATASTGTPSP